MTLRNGKEDNRKELIMINREEALKAMTGLRDDLKLSTGGAREGHWTLKGKHYICSECGSKEKAGREYCPHCGAHMVGDFE